MLSRGLNAVGLAVALLVAAPSWVGAQSQPADARKIRAFSLSKTQALGEAMYAQDQAAWKASDLMNAAKPDMSGVFAWLASSYQGGQRVRWIKGSPTAPEAAYEVVFDGRSTPRFAAAANPTLSPEDLAQLHALIRAQAQPLERCSVRSANHIELRDPDTGEWLVWILAPWTDEEGIPVGGHTRFTFNADGSQLLRQERMSMRCFYMKLEPQKDASPVMITTTQLVADTPLETHVFNALQTHIPAAVITPDATVWAVDGRTIRKVRNLRDGTAPTAPPRSGSSAARP